VPALSADVVFILIKFPRAYPSTINLVIIEENVLTIAILFRYLD